MAIGPRRSRSNDGTPNRVGRVLPIDIGLYNRLMAEFYEPTQRKMPQTYHGPKAARGCPPSVLTDEQVLALRRMRDWLGMNGTAIADATGIALHRVQSVIDYRTRVHLDPGPRPAPSAEAA